MKNKKLIELTENDLQNYWLKRNTKDSIYLCIYNPNVGMDCPLISSIVGSELTASDEVVIALIQYQDLTAAKANALKISQKTSHLFIEIWAKGKKLKISFNQKPSVHPTMDKNHKD